MTRTGQIRATAALLGALCIAYPALATPDLSRPQQAGSLRVFPDDTKATRFYYAPGDLELILDEDGRPDLRLLHMRHTGAAHTGDQGTVLLRSVLSFRVRMTGPTAQDLQAARDALKKPRKKTELRPLPISRMETVLLLDGSGEEGVQPQALPDGHFEADADAGHTTSEGFWTERTYTLRLDDTAAQALWGTFHAGQVALSLGYAYFTPGLPPGEPLVQLTGDASAVQELRERLYGGDGTEGESTEEKQPAPAECPVHAGATAITVDANRWPELFRQVDVDAAAPPAYPLLEVRCYDFSGDAGDLYEKQVEVEAQGVSQGTPRLMVVFNRSEPDLSRMDVRFPVAVRLDRPYRYRVSEITTDGTTTRGEWIESESWARMLDASRRADAGATVESAIAAPEENTDDTDD